MMRNIDADISITPGSRVVIVGLGKSGLAAARFCRKMGAEVYVSEKTKAADLDQNVIQSLDDLDVTYELGEHHAAFVGQADLVLLSPGVPPELPILQEVREQNIPVVGELALAARYLKTPVIAITGTNGKTTVTTLIGEIIRAAGKKVFVGGNIGTPLCEYLLGEQDADFAVLEVSSFQLDTAARFRPHIAVLLNVTPDHLDRYTDFEAYIDSKMSLFRYQQPNDFAIVNGDDPTIMARIGEGKSGAGTINSRILYYGNGEKKNAQANGTELVIEAGIAGESVEHFLLQDAYLSISPNRENCLAAVLAARVLGLEYKSIEKGLRNFVPLAHRMQPVAEIDGVRYINDSKATNVGALHSALASLPGRIILIAGGRDKMGGYHELLDIVKEKVRVMLLIGEARAAMQSVFEGTCETKLLETLPDAVREAGRLARKGDIVLLSPACASFDMFRSYTERGEAFTRAVLALQNNEGTNPAHPGGLTFRTRTDRPLKEAANV